MALISISFLCRSLESRVGSGTRAGIAMVKTQSQKGPLNSSVQAFLGFWFEGSAVTATPLTNRGCVSSHRAPPMYVCTGLEMEPVETRRPCQWPGIAGTNGPPSRSSGASIRRGDPEQLKNEKLQRMKRGSRMDPDDGSIIPLSPKTTPRLKRNVSSGSIIHVTMATGGVSSSSSQRLFFIPLQPTAGIDEATKLLESAVGKSRRLTNAGREEKLKKKKTGEATWELTLTVSITPPPYVPGLS